MSKTQSLLCLLLLLTMAPATARCELTVTINCPQPCLIFLNGEYRVKNAEIKPLFEKAVSALKNFKSFEIRHIDRSENKEADKLVNKAINLSGLFL